MIGVAVSLYALTLQTCLEIPQAFVSAGIAQHLIPLLGGHFELSVAGDSPLARVPYGVIWLVLAAVSLVAWFAGGAWIARRRRVPVTSALGMWGFYGWIGWLPAGAWVIGQIAAETLGWTALGQFLTASCQLWHASLIAAWVAAFCTLLRRTESTSAPTTPLSSPALRVPWGVWVGIAVYVLCFGVMNTQLYRALLVPHGDSAMYEEHLWNLLHGKGFRSYLDQGLFLGEHIQVVHLGLIPLYIFWPSEILLEWCQSIALALGAIPVYRLAARRCGSRSAGICLALAYLLYFPMQRLDISIDFKTFRPEAFGIPLFLCALDALDARRWGWMLGWLAATLTVKEDYGLMIAALGVWIACDAWWSAPAENRRRQHWLGAGMAAFGVAYVLLAVKVLVPYFRAGHQVHYTRYFGKFGNSVSEIALNLLSHPGLAIHELLSPENMVFAVALLAPLGFLPLLAPGRLAVGLPLFGLLCLNEIARNPQHHFHAPLVPVLFWAAAAGLAHLPAIWNALRQRLRRGPYDAKAVLRFGGAWAMLSAAATGIFLSASPL
ncbi:MAG TPA: DUF2079 domain-containing protein, partial [Planctomycetaceae bacterium]|nr:DUF2079 domain-containing protein [Planctomycetaceae bacterium]